ncbi:uncharacterized protein VTP21DRAFT_5499 [Calcarisporiella thermophila]|uniref:uncharacterized protein n=1 Tax=Calcarisporiella thermophila TaxID=911321 RepID=UPI003741F355
MAKKLSAEEKRKRMEDIFHETKEFYQLKELERIAPKMKGIVSQSVKDVLQSLVDDDLITCEKIGTSNYYWSFPSTALQTRKVKIEQLKQELEREQLRSKELQETIEKATQGREESEDRVQKLEELAQAESLRRRNLDELKEYKDNDPTLWEAKEKAAQIAKEGANRWTENVWTLQSYCFNKFNMERSRFNKEFGISEDFDTIP